MGLPSRAVEDAIWAMGPDEIASRANHGPFLINPNSIRASGSPPSATAAQTPTPTTPSGISANVARAVEELGAERKRRGSTQGRRSRTQSTSLGGSGGSSGILLPPLQEELRDERHPAKSEGDEAEQDREEEKEVERGREPEQWPADITMTNTDSPIARAISRGEEVTKA